jgi:hypothetical protein
MLETFVLLVLSLVLGIGSLAWAGWLVLAGQFQTFDGLFLTLVCLVLALVFFINCIWNIRSQEFKEWLQGRERKESSPEAKTQTN